MKATKWEKEIKKDLTEFYFTHCKPKVRPEFKTVDEAEEWNNRHVYEIEQVIQITADLFGHTILSTLQEYADARDEILDNTHPTENINESIDKLNTTYGLKEKK